MTDEVQETLPVSQEPRCAVPGFSRGPVNRRELSFLARLLRNPPDPVLECEQNGSVSAPFASAEVCRVAHDPGCPATHGRGLQAAPADECDRLAVWRKERRVHA